MNEHLIPVKHLCIYSRAAEDFHHDRDGEPVCETVMLEECPLHLEQKYAHKCPCKQVQKVGENVTKHGVRSVCATICRYPQMKNGEQIHNPTALADWVRRTK